MKIISKALSYYKKGLLFKMCRDKITFSFINFFVRNRNITTSIIQNKNYQKLKKEFSYIIDNFETDAKKDSSNKVWFCWLQGYDNAPDLVKACYNSIKENMSDKEIIFLSEKNIEEYVDFPKYIKNKYKTGKICRAHYSDLIRISLLCKYGGLWIDSTVLCTSNNYVDYIFRQPLFVFKQIELTNYDIHPIVSSNWLIYSEKNNEICLLTQKLLFEYWKKYNYAIDYFIFHFFFSMSTIKYNYLWNNISSFNNINPHILQFELNEKYNSERWKQILSFSSFHKLNHHNRYNNRNSFYSHIINLFHNKEDYK